MPHLPRRHFLHSMLAAAGWYRFTPRQQTDMFALVLGTAQDGGLPQAGCYTPRCDTARQNPRSVASLALVDPTADYDRLQAGRFRQLHKPGAHMRRH